MIEIDLLPLELREKKRIPFERIFKRKMLFAVLGSLVLSYLLLHAVTVVTTKRLSTLKRNWQGLSSKKAQIDRLKARLAGASEKIPLIEQLISNRVLWSKKMNEVSDLITGGIWLNEISIKKQKIQTSGELSESLIIQGSAASRTKDEPALIGRFMQNLKNDSSFSAHFAEIELGPIKERQISQTEVMDFILICRFKPDKVQTQ